MAAAAAVILLLGAVVLAVYFGCVRPSILRRRFTSAPLLAGTRIPKVIWTYWNSETPAPFMMKCVGTWRQHHPDYHIVILTPGTLHHYTTLRPKAIPWNDSPAREADIVRVTILAAYGGVWFDMSIVLFAPCPQLREPLTPGTEFIGFYLEGFTTKPAFPVIESWWFATAPGGSFITQWREVFMGLYADLPIADRIARMKAADGIDLQGIHQPMQQYLYIHAAAQYVLQKRGGSSRGMVLWKAEDGPFKYLKDNGWDAAAALAWLASHPQAMIKMRSSERALAEKVLLTDARCK